MGVISSPVVNTRVSHLLFRATILFLMERGLAELALVAEHYIFKAAGMQGIACLTE
jgi:hypothetical protein